MIKPLSHKSDNDFLLCSRISFAKLFASGFCSFVFSQLAHLMCTKRISWKSKGIVILNSLSIQTNHSMNCHSDSNKLEIFRVYLTEIQSNQCHSFRLFVFPFGFFSQLAHRNATESRIETMMFYIKFVVSTNAYNLDILLLKIP